MNDEPIRYLSLAAVARRADRSPATAKRRLLLAGATADAMELPSTTWLYREDRVAELIKLLAAEPEPAALNTEPTALA